MFSHHYFFLNIFHICPDCTVPKLAQNVAHPGQNKKCNILWLSQQAFLSVKLLLIPYQQKFFHAWHRTNARLLETSYFEIQYSVLPLLYGRGHFQEIVPIFSFRGTMEKIPRFTTHHWKKRPTWVYTHEVSTWICDLLSNFRLPTLLAIRTFWEAFSTSWQLETFLTVVAVRGFLSNVGN